jgi:ribosome biogenesis protein MAK21
MGKKRTHAETKDGFSKPSPGHDRMKGGASDRHDRRKPADAGKMRSALVSDRRGGGDTIQLTARQIFKPQPEWHTVELPALPTVPNPTIPPRYILDDLHQYADELLEAETTEYAASHMSKDSSHKFMSTVMASGTMEDKVSALTLLVQESPLHTSKAFDQLIGLSRKKSRNAAMMALAALKDLLGQGVLLPPDRKLKAFARQPGLLSALQGKNMHWKRGEKLPGDLQKIHLIAWSYEDWLKKQYFEMLKIIEGWSNDEVEYSRNRAVTFVWELLKEKPEQEENLLRLLINKLGDKEKKVSSRASYLLLQLQITHPLMKNVIINSIESDLIFRPNQSAHAKYYAVITLNQTVLSVKETEVASKLLEIYFSIFLGLLKKQKEHEKEETRINKHGLVQGGGSKPGKMAKRKAEKEATQAFKVADESREKLISAILTGVNRAFPFAKTDDAKFEQQLNTIFEVTHSSNFNTSIQAMTLIQQISATKHYSTDRFYRTLYESLLDPRLITTSKHIMYLNLLYRSLKADTSVKRVKAFVKRLLQIIHMHEPPFICGVLYLVNELINTFPSIKAMLSTPEDNVDDGEDEHYDDVPEDADEANKDDKSAQSAYDPRKRDPEHAQADMSCLWELLPLQAHHHPSVHVLASKIVNQEPIKEKPDPTIYTLMNFLDKFAFRNAKTKAQGVHGSSIMQPMSGTSKAADYLITSREGDRTHDPLNSESFWRKKIDDVRDDEVFFHTYFEKSGKAKAADKKAKKKKRQESDSENESGDEDEIWKALVKSRPEVEGDSGDDEGFSDIDMEDMMSDDEEGGVSMDAGVELNLGSDDDDAMAPAQAADDDDDDDFADFDLDDEDGFMDDDDEVPVDLNLDDDDTDVEGDDKGEGKNADKKRKKRKLKHLPTFASADAYAKLIGDDDSE